MQTAKKATIRTNNTSPKAKDQNLATKQRVKVCEYFTPAKSMKTRNQPRSTFTSFAFAYKDPQSELKLRVKSNELRQTLNDKLQILIHAESQSREVMKHYVKYNTNTLDYLPKE